MKNCELKFKELYFKEPENISFCPYRICPIGVHNDHQLGSILGFAIDKGIYFAYTPDPSGKIEVSSLQFEEKRNWSVFEIPPVKTSDWADYLRGATLELKKNYKISIGLSGVFEGEIPIGGLSSSAAVTLIFLKALATVNNIKLTNTELIYMAKGAENNYVGVACGKLDQVCEVLCKKDHLLYFDTKTDTYELLPISEKMKPFKVVVFFSGLERSLVNSPYNTRVSECKSAAYALKAFAEIPYADFKDSYLSDIPKDTYLKYKNKLPKTWAKRAEHLMNEFDRIALGVEAWKLGDLETFGTLCTESGTSAIKNYETGCEQLIKLCEILNTTSGIYGGQCSGAGFKGSCIALVDPDKQWEILQKVTQEYITAFPEFRDTFRAFVCETTDGIGN